MNSSEINNESGGNACEMLNFHFGENSPDIKALYKVLECPVCHEVAQQPVYTCSGSQHMVCGRCRRKINECPACNSPVSEQPSNFAEQCMGHMTVPCRNSDEGCDVISKGSELRQHLEQCPFRPIECFITKCGQIIGFSKFFDHIRTVHQHKVNGIDNSNQRTVEWWIQGDPLETARWPPYYFTCFNNVFLYMAISTVHGMWEWIWIIADEEEASRFRVKARIENIDKFAELSWTGIVHSIRKSVHDIVSSGLVFVTTSKELRNPFLFRKNNDDTKYYWRTDVEIFQIMPPISGAIPYILTTDEGVVYSGVVKTPIVVENSVAQPFVVNTGEAIQVPGVQRPPVLSKSTPVKSPQQVQNIPNLTIQTQGLEKTQNSMLSSIPASKLFTAQYEMSEEATGSESQSRTELKADADFLVEAKRKMELIQIADINSRTPLVLYPLELASINSKETQMLPASRQSSRIVENSRLLVSEPHSAKQGSNVNTTNRNSVLLAEKSNSNLNNSRRAIREENTIGFDQSKTLARKSIKDNTFLDYSFSISDQQSEMTFEDQQASPPSKPIHTMQSISEDTSLPVSSIPSEPETKSSAGFRVSDNASTVSALKSKETSDDKKRNYS